uniref:Uncharacterized protein n=1 Tax=Anopheles farauti TaxID=69004 RepID=A0A182Q513_9DIPT
MAGSPAISVAPVDDGAITSFRCFPNRNMCPMPRSSPPLFFTRSFDPLPSFSDDWKGLLRVMKPPSYFLPAAAARRPERIPAAWFVRHLDLLHHRLQRLETGRFLHPERWAEIAELILGLGVQQMRCEGSRCRRRALLPTTTTTTTTMLQAVDASHLLQVERFERTAAGGTVADGEQLAVPVALLPQLLIALVGAGFACIHRRVVLLRHRPAPDRIPAERVRRRGVGFERQLAGVGRITGAVRCGGVASAGERNAGCARITTIERAATTGLEHRAPQRVHRFRVRLPEQRHTVHAQQLIVHLEPPVSARRPTMQDALHEDTEIAIGAALPEPVLPFTLTPRPAFSVSCTGMCSVRISRFFHAAPANDSEPTPLPLLFVLLETVLPPFVALPGCCSSSAT